MAALPARRQPKSAYSTLPHRLRRFVDEYVVGATPEVAMRNSGYVGLHARQTGHKWLKRPNVAAAIAEATQRQVAELGIRQITVIKQFAAIAHCDPRKFEDENGNTIPLHKLDEATAAAIASVEIEEISTQGREGKRYKYKLWDKVKAGDRLGQYLALWDPGSTTVNVDARSVTVNMGAGTAEALQYLADLGRNIAAIGSEAVTAPADQDRSVLPASVCDGQAGHRTSVDAGSDTGDPEQP